MLAKGGGYYEECITDGNRKKGFSEWDGTLRETLNRQHCRRTRTKVVVAHYHVLWSLVSPGH